MRILEVDLPFDAWQGNRAGGPWRAGDPRGVRLAKLEADLASAKVTLAAWRVPVTPLAAPGGREGGGGLLYATRGSGGRRNWALWPSDFDDVTHHKEVAFAAARAAADAEKAASPEGPPRLMFESLMRNGGFSDHVREALEGAGGWRRTYHNPCQLWVAADTDLILDPGVGSESLGEVTLGALDPGDAGVVDEAWEHRGGDSVEYVRRQIREAPSLCARDARTGVPVAWAITHSDGAMGAMVVTAPWRRKGLGRAVARALAKQHLQAHGGIAPFCYIQTHNVASQALFSSLGFKPVLDTTWDAYEQPSSPPASEGGEAGSST